MDYSLVENLKWLRENKTAFLEQLNKILPEDSGLTVEDSWDTIDAFISNLQTDYINLDGGAEEQMERFLNDSLETAISVSSTDIKPYAFYNKTSLKKIKADSVTSIAESAFVGCTGLTEISADSVTSITESAFDGCTALAHASMSALTYIGVRAFSMTAFTNLDWLDMTKIASINSLAFSGCTKLGGDLLLNCPAYVKDSAFAGCKNLERIIITTDVKYVGPCLVATETPSADRPDDYALKYIACEQASQPSGWSSTWNRVSMDYSSSYQWPTYWNATIKDWVFVYNNGKEDSYWTGRVLEEFPDVGKKEDYVFKGWYWDKECTSQATVPCTTTETIPMLYAGWFSTVNLNIFDTENEIWQKFDNIETIVTIAGIIAKANAQCRYGITKLYFDAEFTTEITDDTELYANMTVYSNGCCLFINNFTYTGTVQKCTLNAGTYKLECWGAQGGGGTDATKVGGKGGYSTGLLTLLQNTDLYIYAGGKGTDDDGTYSPKAVLAGGFNGGGYGRAWSGTNHEGGGGGGASDIRLVTDSLYARVIVAGAGGGGSDNGWGGYGGGLTSGATERASATQTSGYSFGKAQNATYSGGECGGGGSGWWGGYGATSENGRGSGGSGYVYTKSTAASYPSGCLLDTSYYLVAASTTSGSNTFTSPDGTEETGHAGNGYVRISQVKA